MADGYGVRVLLRLRRWRHEPVAAESIPQHHGNLPIRGQPKMEPDDSDGRRCHPLDAAAQRHRSLDAVLRPLCSRRHTRAAPRNSRVDREDQQDASV